MILLVLLLGTFKNSLAQSEWDGTWSNWNTKNNDFVLRIRTVGDNLFATWYTNDNWRLYRVELKGKISKRGKKVTGTYLYINDGEKGMFEWNLNEFKKKEFQAVDGYQLYFLGELGINKVNMRNWNSSKRSNDTSMAPIHAFVEQFKKDRPKKYTSEEMVELVHNADFLTQYKELPADSNLNLNKPVELISTCKEGVFTTKGINNYIIGDFYFYQSGTDRHCVIYLNVSDKLVYGKLVKTSDENGVDLLEYQLNGSVKDAVITKMEVINKRQIKIYFSNHTTEGKLSCTLTN